MLDRADDDQYRDEDDGGGGFVRAPWGRDPVADGLRLLHGVRRDHDLVPQSFFSFLVANRAV